jgi:hypothetical protein
MTQADALHQNIHVCYYSIPSGSDGNWQQVLERHLDATPYETCYDQHISMVPITKPLPPRSPNSRFVPN